ncbi:MAG: hypothetical protein LBQ97_02625 [Fusobacteriaceae bacterium]|jgi:hypothetical protein|nr:hypothetical protein [Fusobacteriaceae bacterium]
MEDIFNPDFEEAKEEIQRNKSAASGASISDEIDGEAKEDKTEIVLKNGDVLKFDFSKINTKKITLIKDRYNRDRGKNARLIPEVDEVYMAMVAEYATGTKYEDILKLHPKDMKKISDVISDFLS